MKKFFAILLSLILGVSMLVALTGCGNEEYTQDGKKIINVHIPTQTPSLAMLKMLLDNEQVDSENYDVTYNLENGSDAIRAAMLNPSKKADIVIAPTHIIAGLYNQAQNPVKYKIAAATSFGAFHIISTDPAVTTFADLQGQTIYCQGAAGGSNEYILRYLLQELDITAQVEFSTTVPALLKQGTIKIGLIPEPALTTAKKALNAAPAKEFTTIDLQEDVWKPVTGQDNYPLACLAFREDFLANNKEFCDAFVAKVEASVNWITEEASAEEIAAAITKVKTDSEERLDTGVDPAFFNALDPNSVDRLNIGYKPSDKGSVAYYLTVMGIFDNMFYTP